MARAPYSYFLIIIALSTLINILALRKGHEWGDDFALYIAQAKSLVEGKVEKLREQNTFAMANSSYPIGPNLAPWGFPIILSPIYAFFGLNLLPMKLIEIFFFELSVVIIFFMFLGKLDSLSNLFLVSFFAFNPFFLLFNGHIISDIPYLFFSLFSIFMIEKILICNRTANYRSAGLALIGFLIFLSNSIKPIGFTLLFSLFAVQVISTVSNHGRKPIRYTFSSKLFWLPYGIFVLSELILHLLLPSGFESYLLYFSSINLAVLNDRIYYYINLPSELFGAYYPSIIYGSTLPFIASGINKNFKIDYLYSFYSVLLLFILILLPYQGGPRYILPIFPFFVYFFCIGVNKFYSLFHLSIIKFHVSIRSSYVIMGIIVFALILYSAQIIYANSKNKRIVDGPFTEKSLEMFNFISHNANENDVIVFFKPRILRLLTGRQSIMIADFSQLMQRSGDYLVIRKSGGSYDQISPDSKAFSRITEMFPVVFENVDFIIFRLKKFGSPGG